MDKSKDSGVQKLIADLKALHPDKYHIVQKCRDIVFSASSKEVGERVMYGGIMFSLDEDFGGVFVSKNHVSFEFSTGYKLTDPNKILEGSGKYRRHLKFKKVDDIENNQLGFFVKQVV